MAGNSNTQECILFQTIFPNISTNAPAGTMECFIVEQANVREESRELRLLDEEAHHLHVFRIAMGERFLVTNLLGTCYECERIDATFEKRKEPEVRCRILKVLPDFGEPSTDVMLIQAVLAQPARWEWLLEKATELGVRVIQPIATNRSENRPFKPERSERVLRAAVKQCRRANKPWLRVEAESPGEEVASGTEVTTNSELSSLERALSYALDSGRAIFVFHEAASSESNFRTLLQTIEAGTLAQVATSGEAGIRGNRRRLALVIGPEGGFDDDEIALAREKYSAQIASLGERRLRAETAAIAALAIAISD